MSFFKSVLLISCVVLLSLRESSAQGTITFDGPPLQPPGSASVVQAYQESGVWFAPILGTAGFIRSGSNPREFWPDNGTAYVDASLGDSLMFGLDDGSEFSLISVDLAEWSTGYPEPVSVRFVGYKSDGSRVTAQLVTDGIFDGTGPLADFETLYFDSGFTGLTRVHIPTTSWHLDNLVIAVPEPGTASLILFGLGALALKRRR
ncbi:hypothetical protein SDC9_151384 [bioreactor metagenome]|uniref:Ice-binding protein C-terminal domain-containing protein n=1 Tax=bioreactor metagenome TaxID=1076179 RepID=A0A645EQ53_9ZZZZ